MGQICFGSAQHNTERISKNSLTSRNLFYKAILSGRPSNTSTTSNSKDAIGDGVYHLHSEQTISPPHYLTTQIEHELARNFTFFVSIFGIRCRCLSSKFIDDAGYFITVNWDDYSFYKKSGLSYASVNPKWPHGYQFNWIVNRVEEMKERFLIISVFREVKKQSQLVGSVYVDTLTIASGPTHHDLRLISMCKDTTNCERIVFEVFMSQICELIINPIEILVHIHDNVEKHDGSEEVSKAKIDEDYTVENEELITSPHSGGVIESTNSSNYDGTSNYAADFHNAIRWVNLEDGELNDSVEVLAENSEIDPLRAYWQLGFIPTRVDNPAEYFSKWVEKCSQPYWNAIDHSMLGEGANSNTPSTKGNKIHREEVIDKTNEFDLNENEDILSSDDPEYRDDEYNGYMDITKQFKRSESIEAAYGEERTFSTKATEEVSTSTLKTQPSLRTPLDHLDAESTYQKLAALCRQGWLVKNVLYDDFPTIQLVTSVEQLRQNHLHINLYSRQFESEVPKFYGEAWLPFFKIYDADVVDQLNKHFFDSYFREKLWFDGKCIGHIEGIIVFQNNPIFRQMHAGVHTENGLMRITPPILGAEHKSLTLASRNQAAVQPEIANIASLHKWLLDIVFQISQHKPREAATKIGAVCNGTISGSAIRPQELLSGLQSACDMLLAALKKFDSEEYRTFTYNSEYALVIAQRVFLNLADHIIEYVGSVLWQFRRAYWSILQHILKRGEIEISTCNPSIPDEVKHLSLSEIWVVYRVMKCLKKIGDTPVNGSSSLTSVTSAGSHVGSTVKDKSVGSENRRGIRGRSFPQAILGLSTVSKEMSTESIREINACVDTGERETYERVTEQFIPLQSLALSLLSSGSERIALFHNRMKLYHQYFLLMHRILYYALHKLCTESTIEGQGKHISFFLCSSYFRLPIFREELCSCILSTEETQLHIQEWRGTHYDLNEEHINQNKCWSDAMMRSIFDWSSFHMNLKSYFGEAALMESLMNLKEKSLLPLTWKSRFKARDSLFFSFVEHWSKYVYQSIEKKGIVKWNTIPGYLTLLKGLLLEMKMRDVTKYPDALLNCSGAMLANERLLSVFIKVIFLKTSVYDTSAVFAALNYVDYWLQGLNLRNQMLPSNFDFKFLKKGLGIILDCEICLNVSKCLWFLFKNLPFFQGKQLRYILDLLLKNQFMNLFLNWSWLVRKCYMSFLLYRICAGTHRIARRLKTNQTLGGDECIILEAYSEMVGCLKLLGVNVSQLEEDAKYLDDVTTKVMKPKELQSEKIQVKSTPTVSVVPSQQRLYRDSIRDAKKFAYGGRGVKSEGIGEYETSSNDEVVHLDSECLLEMSEMGMRDSESIADRCGGDAVCEDTNITCKSLYAESVTSGGSIPVFPPSPQRSSSSLTPSLYSTDGRCDVNTNVLTPPTSPYAHPFELSLKNDKKSSLFSISLSSTERVENSGDVFNSMSVFDLNSIPSRLIVYQQRALIEFEQEVLTYKEWVSNGAHPLPTLHIPASPLDYNVDVPLDNW